MYQIWPDVMLMQILMQLDAVHSQAMDNLKESVVYQKNVYKKCASRIGLHGIIGIVP